LSQLTHISPFFIVANLEASVSFYVDKLGFTVLHQGPEGDPYWAMIGRDHIAIMLKTITGEVRPVPNYTRHPWAAWDAYISTDDPEGLFGEYRSRGVLFRKPLHINSDRLLGFELQDADGYVLFFGRPDSNEDHPFPPTHR